MTTTLELESVTTLISKRGIAYIMHKNEIADEDLNALSAYYTAKEQLPENDQQTWIVNRIKELVCASN